MHRAPLLRSLSGSPGGSPRTPFSVTPRSPVAKWNKLRVLVNIVTLISGILAVSLMATTASHVLWDKAGDESSFSTPGEWGPEAERYQACRSDPTADLPVLRPVKRWRSAKEMPSESITIVTQLSLERLTMLQGQCQAWTDRIAAVVYVPLISKFGAGSAEIPAINGSSVATVSDLLQSFHDETEEFEGGCALDIELVVEVFHSWEDPRVGLYPFNAVRNRALLLANTELLLLLDADFLPSASLPLTYQHRALVYRDLLSRLTRQRTAMVLPAFGTAGDDSNAWQLATQVTANGKAHAVEAWEKGDLVGFQVAQYAAGHSPTNYTRWAATSGRPYSVQYAKGYEPYIVIPRQFVPFYDERFRGYGRDKIVHLAHLTRGLGVRLEVHPSAFVVHAPHKKAATFRATKASGQWEKLGALYRAVRKEIDAGEFVPVTIFAELCPRTVVSGAGAPAIEGRRTSSRKAGGSSGKGSGGGKRQLLLDSLDAWQ